eukprot:4285676-Lingulodinium_polyedra.AAC.1
MLGHRRRLLAARRDIPLIALATLSSGRSCTTAHQTLASKGSVGWTPEPSAYAGAPGSKWKGSATSIR